MALDATTICEAHNFPTPNTVKNPDNDHSPYSDKRTWEWSWTDPTIPEGENTVLFTVSVSFTASAYADLCHWDETTERRKPGGTGQDTAGRVWDVLATARRAAQAALIDASFDGSARRKAHVYRVPPTGRGLLPRLTEYAVHVGGGDAGEPVVTIMLPHED